MTVFFHLEKYDFIILKNYSPPELDTVYFGLDPNILIRPDSQRTVELPEYLYNDNPLDDIQVYLSADALSMAVRTLWARETGAAVTLDEAYTWDRNTVFSRVMALSGYVRPEVSGETLPADAYLPAAKENMDVILGWAGEHPDVQFNIWFPPYSILYWDKTTREGTAEAIITALEYAAERTLEYDNVRLYTYLTIGQTTDLDNYTDHTHCSAALCSWTARTMMRDYWRLTEENYRRYMEELRGYVAGYDYEAIFEGWSWDWLYPEEESGTT